MNVLEKSSREDVAKRIEEKLAETSSAQTGDILPKGTVMEQEMIAAETPPVIPEKNNPAEKVVEPKRGRGRPKGTYKTKKVTKKKETDGTTTETISESEHDTPPAEQVDMFTPIANNALVPLIAWITKKDAENLKITEQQGKEINKLMPPDNDLFKPSWPAFFTAMALTIAGNAMYAPKRNAETEELAELKKALLKAVEVEELKKSILEMQQKMSEMHQNMRVIRPDNNGHYHGPEIIVTGR